MDTKKEKPFGKKAKWEGKECPDEGEDRLESCRIVGTNEIASKVKLRHHTPDKSSLTLLWGLSFYQTASQNM